MTRFKTPCACKGRAPRGTIRRSCHPAAHRVSIKTARKDAYRRAALMRDGGLTNIHVKKCYQTHHPEKPCFCVFAHTPRRRRQRTKPTHIYYPQKR